MSRWDAKKVSPSHKPSPTTHTVCFPDFPRSKSYFSTARDDTNASASASAPNVVKTLNSDFRCKVRMRHLRCVGAILGFWHQHPANQVLRFCRHLSHLYKPGQHAPTRSEPPPSHTAGGSPGPPPTRSSEVKDCARKAGDHMMLVGASAALYMTICRARSSKLVALLAENSYSMVRPSPPLQQNVLLSIKFLNHFDFGQNDTMVQSTS